MLTNESEYSQVQPDRKPNQKVEISVYDAQDGFFQRHLNEPIRDNNIRRQHYVSDC
jgi:hypothetical protein